MSAEPTEAAINEFVNITNVTREKAIAFLKANNLDPNRAIDSYFENPNGPGPATQEYSVPVGPQQQAYDYQSQNFPSTFDTNSSDKSRYGVAPSRPPSRIGPREPQEGVNIAEAVEMSAEPSSNKTHKMTATEREEHEMRQALAMSLCDNPDHFQQETGVVDVDGPPKFGPATRDHYDEQNWALTLPFAASREVCVDPDPEERRRVQGEPAFLRPSEDADHLSSVITILHAIPLAREALLHRGRIATDYGYDAQWWNGQTIELPDQTLPAEDSEAPQSGVKDEILLETQRLMGFLDKTERAFGSSDSLARIRTVGSFGPAQRIARFLKAWDDGKHERQGGSVFANRVVKRSDEADEYPTVNTFTIAEFTSLPEQAENLYDVIDTNLWADIPGEELDDAWFDRVADIFTIRLSASASNTSVGIKIPAVWYPDRYLESCKEYSKELRRRRLETDAELERLQTLIYRISECGEVTEGATSFKTMMEKAIMGSDIALKNDQPNGSADGEEQHSGISRQADAGQFATRLRAIADQVQQKLSDLEKRKEEAIKSLKEFSRRLTGPSDSPEYTPCRKYTLRGVCTLPYVMYVLRRDDRQLGHTDKEEGVDNWQWWRISYSVEDGAARMAEADQQPAVPSSVEEPSSKAQETKRRRIPIPSNTDVMGHTVRRVRQVEVLRAAKEESSTVVLVYASEDAVNFKESDIPPSLQTFVNTDNEAFEQELQDADWQQTEQGVQNEDDAPALSDTQMQPVPEDTEMQDRGRSTDRLPRSGENEVIKEPSDSRETVTAHSSIDRAGQRLEMQQRHGPGLLASARNRPTPPDPSPSEMELVDGRDAGPFDPAFE